MWLEEEKVLEELGGVRFWTNPIICNAYIFMGKIHPTFLCRKLWKKTPQRVVL